MSESLKADPDYERNYEVFANYWTQRWRRANTYSTQSKVRRFRKFLRGHDLLPARDLKVFDQGFGLGLMLFCFDASCSLAGLELSFAAVDAVTLVAKQKGYSEVDLRIFKPDAPYPEEWQGTFDIVISSHVLEHIDDPVPALRSLLALLRPGGYICVVVPIHEKPGEDPNHFHQFTAEHLKDLLRRCDLTMVDLWETDRLWHLMAPIAYRQARKRTVPLRMASIAMNTCGFLPMFMMSMVDTILAPFGAPNRQCFALARKPSPDGTTP